MYEEPVKISKTEFLILQIMTNHGAGIYGLEIIRKSENRIKHGTIYTTLSRMEDKGVITSTKEEKIQEGLTAKRRMYTITGAGVRAMERFQCDIGIIQELWA